MCAVERSVSLSDFFGHHFGDGLLVLTCSEAHLVPSSCAHFSYRLHLCPNSVNGDSRTTPRSQGKEAKEKVPC